ncbi:hypothetical protein JG687_00008367 [Phytophthora cactorum]|uniref:Uncharacterized protein n=1 Tax=Phytophthora cactorum TaxID=29920 RepID=A0A8T1UF08_9STRA|nr:hypothetical protein JG687_00008367 [Phytophthora cactorum]
MTVTLPVDKTTKALTRVDNVRCSGTTTKKVLLQLLGSLGHAATCCPQSRAFYQRLQVAASSSRPYGPIS